MKMLSLGRASYLRISQGCPTDLFRLFPGTKALFSFGRHTFWWRLAPGRPWRFSLWIRVDGNRGLGRYRALGPRECHSFDKHSKPHPPSHNPDTFAYTPHTKKGVLPASSPIHEIGDVRPTPFHLMHLLSYGPA